jgi:hypothetical protein
MVVWISCDFNEKSELHFVLCRLLFLFSEMFIFLVWFFELWNVSPPLCVFCALVNACRLYSIQDPVAASSCGSVLLLVFSHWIFRLQVLPVLGFSAGCARWFLRSGPGHSPFPACSFSAPASISCGKDLGPVDFPFPARPGSGALFARCFWFRINFFWAVFFSRGPRFSLLQKTSSIAADLSAWSAGQLPIFF